MKIGVFGDSFATRHDNGHGLAWYEMIQNKLNCEVISYGVAGSSLHYSYKKFIENHTKHDKIIILTTAFSRINLPIKPEYLEKNPKLEHLNQLSYFINHVKNMEKSHYLDEMVKALKYYYTYIQDHDKDQLFFKLLLKDINSIRPDSLLIPGSYLIPEHNWNSEKILGDVSVIDFRHYELEDSVAYLKDIRHCHLSQENNEIFSNMILEWISTGVFNFDFNKFVTSLMPINYYFNV